MRSPTVKDQYAAAGITEIDTISEMMDSQGATPESHEDYGSPGTCRYCGEAMRPGPCDWRTFYFAPGNPTPCEAKDCPGCAECDAEIGFGGGW